MTRKHLLLMAIGCIVPIIALATIFLFQIKVSTVLLLGLFLLCPVLHLWMMRSHMGHSEHPLEKIKLPSSSDNIGVRRTAAFRE